MAFDGTTKAASGTVSDAGSIPAASIAPGRNINYEGTTAPAAVGLNQQKECE